MNRYAEGGGIYPGFLPPGAQRTFIAGGSEAAPDTPLAADRVFLIEIPRPRILLCGETLEALSSAHAECPGESVGAADGNGVWRVGRMGRRLSAACLGQSAAVPQCASRGASLWTSASRPMAAVKGEGQVFHTKHAPRTILRLPIATLLVDNHCAKNAAWVAKRAKRLPERLD
jgi:hypothetical protein